MSGPAFGFSAGDFIAAVTLIVDVTKALKDAGGASEEYRSLVQELGLLGRILTQLNSQQQTGNVFAADIAQQTDLTLATLNAFLLSVSKFDAKLGNRSPSAWHRGAARKAQWAVTYAKEVDKLRVKVGMHLNQLNFLLQLQTNTGVESIGTKLDQISMTIDAQNQNSHMLARPRQPSVSLGELNARLDAIGISQETLLDEQHLAAKQLGVTAKGLQEVTAGVTTLDKKVDSQSCQVLALRQGIATGHQNLTTEVQASSQLTRQGFHELASKSDQILQAMSNTHRDGRSGSQVLRLSDQDEVLLLLLQLLRALSRSMGDLLSKTTLLFPLIFASLQTLTTTIRREPFLLAKDSITFIDALGREYMLQHSYFRDWRTFDAFLRKQFRGLPGERYVTAKSYCLRSVVHTSDGLSRSWYTPMDPSCWDYFLPGMRISMSVYRTQTDWGDYSGECSFGDFLVNRDGVAWIDWYYVYRKPILVDGPLRVVIRIPYYTDLYHHNALEMGGRVQLDKDKNVMMSHVAVSDFERMKF